VRANTKLQNAHEFDAINHIRDKSHWTSTMWRESPLPQNLVKIRVDLHPLPASVIVPREAGLLHFGVRSTYILGLQIGSILSRLTAVALAKAVHSDQD